MIERIKDEIKKILAKAGVTGEIGLTIPPNAEMGDFSFACFDVAKKEGKNPKDVAEEIVGKIKRSKDQKIIERVQAAGPYVNFFLSGKELANIVFEEVKKYVDAYGTHTIGKGKTVMVEFAHPNTHKAFHIGHLRNIVTGESIARIIANAGYKVIRVNYQGDVGLHIAKCLWGIEELQDEYETAKKADAHAKADFLGKAYARGAQAFEKGEKEKKEIVAYNKKIYTRDPSIGDVYETTRAWSLAYFDHLYTRVNTHFDRLYFESEVAMSGAAIVREFLEKGVFVASQGAIIFEGSKYGLHDRVFINSEGFPTYEGKEIGLADLQFREFHPDAIVHITAHEQVAFFQVVFKALEFVFPKVAKVEKHISYGWVRLKHGKMSSRAGQVVLGEWLLDEVEKMIKEIMGESSVSDKELVKRRVGLAATKYSLLKTSVANDIVFDLEESVKVTGDSGPYLLYIVARIKSMLRKSRIKNLKSKISCDVAEPEEKLLLMKIASFPEVTKEAFEHYDPSKVAQYLFDLARAFNNFYERHSVLKAEKDVQVFRLQLIQIVASVMERGLGLLGIQTVEEM